MIKYRLISSIVLIIIVIAVLLLFSPTGFAITTLAVCMLAAWEWGKFSYSSVLFKNIFLLVLFSFLLTLMLFLLSNNYNDSYRLTVSIILWTSIVWWIVALLLVYFYPYSTKIWKYSRIWNIVSCLLTIIPFFSGMIILRIWNYSENYYNGSLWIFYIMSLVWGADSGAYIIGKVLGKHKLIPKISPQKTWQGFIGGVMIATFIAWSYSILMSIDISKTKLLICSIISILASVLGDLTESMFKREAGIKDSSHLIPGHGGILDCIDSLMAAVPVFVCLLFHVLKMI